MSTDTLVMPVIRGSDVLAQTSEPPADVRPRRRLDWAILSGLLAVVGVVHAWNMNNDPLAWTSDPGTYVSQAWAVQHLGRLAPYSYTYDHVPGAWIQMAIWSMVTNGFGRYSSGIAFGDECALIAALATAGMLYALARRLSFGRLAATSVVLVWGLCPLAIQYARPAFIDNFATPWLLLSFYLAMSKRRSLGASIGAAAAFSAAALSKETILVILPALAYVYVQNSHPGTRRMTWSLSFLTLLFLGGSYLAYAGIKGELLPRHGRNTLLSEAAWQLWQRQSTGSILDSVSPIHLSVWSWLAIDWYLLAAGFIAVIPCMLVRRMRPIVTALVIQTLMVVKGGYVPYMQITDILPWAALATIGGIAITIGAMDRSLRTYEARARIWLIVRRCAAATVAVACVVIVAPHWFAGDAKLVSLSTPTPEQEAISWIGANVPRSDTVVADPQMLADLWGKDGFPIPHAVAVDKLDADPAVARATTHIDYIAVQTSAYTTLGASTSYPSLFRAEQYGIVVARFGSGPNGVVIWRISPLFDLRSPG